MMESEYFGPYRIDGLLGRGGMGEVHRAYDTAHDRVVALKRLLADADVDESFRARFRRESQIVARLREPHVIPVHAYGEIDGRLYLDMRLVDGVDLKDLLAKGPLDPQRTVKIVSQVASALDAAHADGLIHRDVKPSNVLVTGDDFVYLVDFGIARSMSATSTSITGTGNVIGTLDYLAPERFAAGPIDGRVDVYALACVFFECLTGSRPFPVDGAAAQMGAHLTTPPPLLSIARPGLPRGFDDVVARGMAKDPAQRFSTAGEFAAAATAALTTVPEPPRMPTWQHTVPTPSRPFTQPVTMQRPPVKEPTRRLAIVGAIVAVLVAAGLVAGGIVWLAGSDRSSASEPTPTPTPTSEIPPPPSSTPTTPTTTPKASTEAVDKLAAQLPSAYRGNSSCRAETSPPSAQAVINCTEANVRNQYFEPPSGTRFYSFANRADQDAFFTKLVGDNHLTRKDSLAGCHPLIQTKIYGLYNRADTDAIPGEYLSCFVENNQGEVWWVDTRKLVVGCVYSTTATSNDALDKLSYWWNEEILSEGM
jgi:serine/threonine protein kinase